MPDATQTPNPTRPYSEARIYRQGTSRGKHCQATDPIGRRCPNRATRLHSIEWRDSSGLGQYLPLAVCDQHLPRTTA